MHTGSVGALIALAFVLLIGADPTLDVTVVAMVLVAVLVVRSLPVDDVVLALGSSGPNTDEGPLRGALRRQSAPDAPGRPRPRAPGTGPRPA